MGEALYWEREGDFLKVGVISDTHGNLSGFIDAIEFLREREQVAKLFFLGHEYQDFDKVLEVKRALRTAKAKKPEGEDEGLGRSLFDELARQQGIDEKPKMARTQLDETEWLEKQAVRLAGEDDPEALFGKVPEMEFELVGGRIVCAAHNPKSLSKEDIASANLVVYGHTHLYQVDKVSGRYFLNPGHLMETEDQGRPPTFAVLDLGPEPRFTIYDLSFEVVEDRPLELETKRKFSIS